MAVSKRVRFEVLRRDNHACRYCGQAAPDVKLHVDHVIPTTLGGADTPENLVTACAPCNLGKASTSPDEHIIADVAADALRWAAAIKHAAAIASAQQADRDRDAAEFLDRWEAFDLGFEHMPSNWSDSVQSLLAAGLPMDVLKECIYTAVTAPNVSRHNTFRYTCGVAWRHVRDIQNTAKDLLTAEDPA